MAGPCDVVNDQGEAIRALLEQAGFVDAQTVQDLMDEGLLLP